jgi:hypothetical protein
VRSIPIGRESWIPAAETATFLALLHEHLNADSDSSVFDDAIEALV